MILVYLINDVLLTYTFDCTTNEYELIEDDIRGMTNAEISKEIASSRKAML